MSDDRSICVHTSVALIKTSRFKAVVKCRAEAEGLQGFYFIWQVDRSDLSRCRCHAGP